MACRSLTRFSHVVVSTSLEISSSAQIHSISLSICRGSVDVSLHAAAEPILLAGKAR